MKRIKILMFCIALAALPMLLLANFPELPDSSTDKESFTVPTPTGTATPQPTAPIGSLPVTQMPDVAVIPLVVTELTSLPCTHFATNKGKASWAGSKSKPWPLSALQGSKESVLKKWQIDNHRRAKVCGSQDFAMMQKK